MSDDLRTEDQPLDHQEEQKIVNEEGALAEALEEVDADLATPEQVADGEPVFDTGMRPRLVLKRGGSETDIEFPLNPPSTVGRFDPAVGPIDVDLGSVDEGVYVSRKHAKITCDDGVWRVHDLGSSNGTFVLGSSDFERVEAAEIEDGQEIAFGNARFVFKTS
jgi:pSer/pThr/pTyr-binding forkhead associated (FHA) protein